MPTEGFHFWIINYWKYVKSNKIKFQLFTVENRSSTDELYWVIILCNFEFHFDYIK